MSVIHMRTFGKHLVVDPKTFFKAVDNSPKKRSKYNATRVTVNGRTFDSKLEAAVADDLEGLKRAGTIVDIEYQVPFELIPKPNRITYKADFVVTYADGHKEVIDAKGVETATFKLKAKLFRHFYPDIPLKLRKYGDQ